MKIKKEPYEREIKIKRSWTKKDGTTMTKTYTTKILYTPKYKEPPEAKEVLEAYEVLYPELVGHLKYNDEYKLIVSDTGRVFSMNTKHGEIGKNATNHGYKSCNGYPVHRIVWETFKGKYDLKVYEVDHKDDDRGNNDLSNLQLLTHAENMKKAISTRSGVHWMAGVTGKQHVRSKEVHQYDKELKFIKTWESRNMAANALGINQANIQTAVDKLNIKGGHRTAAGYIWLSNKITKEEE